MVELGAGAGLAGLYAATLGAHVLLTDVPSVVQLLERNIAANQGCVSGERAASADEPASCLGANHPSFPGAGDGFQSGLALHHACLQACTGNAAGGAKCSRMAHAPRPMDIRWHGAKAVGAGSAVAAALDWIEEISAQVHEGCNDPRDADLVLACEVVWLAELVEPFVRTLAGILRGRRRPKCLMTYTDRGTASSRVFAYGEHVRECLRAHGCDVEELPEFQSHTADGECVYAWVVTLPSKQLT